MTNRTWIATALAVALIAGVALLLLPRGERAGEDASAESRQAAPSAIVDQVDSVAIAAPVESQPGPDSDTPTVVSGFAPDGTHPVVRDDQFTTLVLTGRVTNTDNEPLEGVVVTMQRRVSPPGEPPRLEDRSTTTNADGRYTIEEQVAVLEGLIHITVIATHPGYHTHRVLVGIGTRANFDQAPPPRTLHEYPIVLTNASPLAGRIIDTDGNPVADAWIAVAEIHEGDPDMRSRRRTTAHYTPFRPEADGTFTIPAFEGLSYLVATGRRPGTIIAAIETTAPDRNIELVVPAGRTRLSGTVVNRRTGEPVPDFDFHLSVEHASPVPQQAIDETTTPRERAEHAAANISRHGMPHPRSTESITTDAQGQFAIEWPEPGTYTPRLPYNSEWFLLPNQPPFEIAEGDNITDTVLLVQDAFPIRGRVFLEGTNQPVPDLKLTLTPDYRRPQAQPPIAVTDRDGRFTMLARQMGGLLRVDSDDYAITTARLPSGQPFFFNVPTYDGEEELEIEVTRQFTVSGHVRTRDGAPVLEGSVQLRAQVGYQERTEQALGAGGTFSFKLASGTSFSLRYTGPEFPEAETETFHLADKPLENIEIVVSSGATLSGVVVGPDERPVAFAEVSAWNRSPHIVIATAHTDREGAFTLRNLPPGGVVSLGASAPNLAPSAAVRYTLEPGQTRTDARIVLRAVGRLAGVVIDANDRPVADARIDFHTGVQAEYRSATSTSEGRFSVDAVSGVSYEVHINADNPQRFRVLLTVAPRENIVVRLDESERAASPDPPLPSPDDPLLFLGTVIDARTRAPLAEFTVGPPAGIGYAPRPTLDRSVAGLFRYDLRGLHVPVFTVRAPGYATNSSPYTRITQEMLDAGVYQHTFEMQPESRIIGRAIDRETGEPLAGVRVEHHGPPPAERHIERAIVAVEPTDAEGRFVVGGVPVGENLIHLLPAAPFMHQSQTVPVARAGETIDLGDIAFHSGRTLRVEIFDTSTQSRRPGVTLVVSAGGDAPRMATTDEHGIAAVEGLPYSALSVSIEGTPLTSSLPEGPHDQVIRLPIGTAGVEITFLDAGEVIIPGHWAFTRAPGRELENSARQPPDGIIDTAVGLDRSGVYEDDRLVARGLAAGKWSFWAQNIMGGASSDTRLLSESVRLVDGETLRLTLSFERDSISGIVLGPDGSPVPGARVTATSNMPRQWHAETDSSGAFRLENVDPGVFLIRAEHDAVGVALMPGVRLERGKPVENLVLQLEPAGDGGTLVSWAYVFESGAPHRSAWCLLIDSTGAEFVHGAPRNQEGMMRITGIPPGRYTAEVGYLGNSFNIHEVDIAAGKTVEIEDVLHAAGVMQMILRDKDGRPIIGRAYRVTPLSPDSIIKPRTGVTNLSGEAFERGLQFGRYVVEVETTSGEPASAEFQIHGRIFHPVRVTLDEEVIP